MITDASSLVLIVMEFPQTGDKCSVENCGFLDFLPIECTHCHNVFCKDHSSPTAHLCSAVKDNVIVDPKITPGFRCSWKGCRDSSAIELNCDLCSKHFCPSHRHHGCTDVTPELSKSAKNRAVKEEFSRVKAETDKMVQERLKNAKNRALANKIKLMKIKGGAVGDNHVPTYDRIFFAVAPPLAAKAKSVARPLFLSKTWTLGKSVDSLAKRLKLNNNNNIPTEPQLTLFNSSGCPLSSGFSATMGTLIDEGVLVDGDSLILEYIPPSELSSLTIDVPFIPTENLSKYSFI